MNTGANAGDRTPDLLITNQLLYRLSYVGDESNKRKRNIARAVRM